MDNYTKGKWAISQHHLGTFIVTENRDGVRTTIATIEQAYPKGIGQLANAHLIASAPDLYEALKEVVEELLTCEQEAQDERTQSRIESTRHIIEQALAKAEGK